MTSVRHAEAGLTLVEMMAVLAIIGVAAGALTLGLGVADRVATVESEARRLAGTIQAASDDAMLGDRLVALTVDKNGYGVSAWTGRGWARRGDYHRIPGAMVVAMDTTPPILLGADGSGQPLTATVTSGGRGWRVRYDGVIATAEAIGT